MSTIAAVPFSSMTGAILIGWIMSVVLHEFAHGLVAHLGGDHTIRERGGLSLNPIQYVDPVFSLLLPAVFLLLGGVPLPGGATYVRRDLLRNSHWDAAVSLAGPATNFLLFLLLALPLHPRVGWIDTAVPPQDAPQWQVFVGAMVQLQMMAVIFNLLPVPPLDGFGIAAAYMRPETRRTFYTPPVSTVSFLILFGVLWRVPGLTQAIFRLTDTLLQQLGFDAAGIGFIAHTYNLAMFGSTY